MECFSEKARRFAYLVTVNFRFGGLMPEVPIRLSR